MNLPLTGRAARMERRQRRRERIRWWVADLFNRSRRTCWCDLVGWVQRTARDRRDRQLTLRSTFSAAGCRTGADFDRCGSCYCGKFRTAAVDAEMKASGGGHDGFVVDRPGSVPGG